MKWEASVPPVPPTPTGNTIVFTKATANTEEAKPEVEALLAAQSIPRLNHIIVLNETDTLGNTKLLAKDWIGDADSAARAIRRSAANTIAFIAWTTTTAAPNAQGDEFLVFDIYDLPTPDIELTVNTTISTRADVWSFVSPSLTTGKSYIIINESLGSTYSKYDFLYIVANNRSSPLGMVVAANGNNSTSYPELLNNTGQCNLPVGSKIAVYELGWTF